MKRKLAKLSNSARFFGYLLIGVFLNSCNPPPPQGGPDFSNLSYIEQIQAYRAYKDSLIIEALAPLEGTFLPDETGLSYFPPDSVYRIAAKYSEFPFKEKVELGTTTHRMANFRAYGELLFELHDETYRLVGYKSLDYDRDELFIPFLDETNGLSSYGGGRYLEIKLPDTSEVILDFNYAYNPYCAYNSEYSCVVPPKDNHLEVKIEAGERYVPH